MATTMNRHSSYHSNTAKSSMQKVCITLGIFFVLLSLIGIIMPGFMGMHLSMTHNLIHLATGALALMAGFADDSSRAYNFAVAFGTVYGLLAIAGFVIGMPGYPGVGNMEADQNLLRIIPNVLEIGTADHTSNMIVSAVLLMSAFIWKRRHQDVDRTVVDRQRSQEKVFTTNTTGSNVGTDLHRSELGRSDIDRGMDRERRADFEERI